MHEGHPGRVPEWLRPLMATIPDDQALVTPDIYSDLGTLQRIASSHRGVRLRLVVAPRMIESISRAHAGGFDDVVTPLVRDLGWDARLSPARRFPHRDDDVLGMAIVHALDRNVSQIAARAYLGTRTFGRRCMHSLGLRPHDALLLARIDRALHLRACNYILSDIAPLVGYSGAPALCRAIRSLEGRDESAPPPTFRAWEAAQSGATWK